MAADLYREGRVVVGLNYLTYFFLISRCALLSDFHQFHIPSSPHWRQTLADFPKNKSINQTINQRLIFSYLGEGVSLPLLLLVSGVVTSVLAWLGCWGSIRSVHSVLYTYICLNIVMDSPWTNDRGVIL